MTVTECDLPMVVTDMEEMVQPPAEVPGFLLKAGQAVVHFFDGPPVNPALSEHFKHSQKRNDLSVFPDVYFTQKSEEN